MNNPSMEAARLATVADVPDIEWVALQVLEEQQSVRGGSLFQRREAVTALADISLAVSDDTAVVGTYDDVVLGYGIAVIEALADGSRLGRIQALAVQADARGSGIGEAIMNLMLERLTESGCFGVDSIALPGDRNTKNFFESFGLKARMLIVHRDLS